MHRRTRTGAAVGALALLAAAAVAARPGPAPAGELREFTVIAERYKFTPNRLEVNEGDTVRVTVRSADNTHGWKVKALDVDLLAKKGGRPETFEFVADKAGTFKIACSEYCGKGHDDMTGVLVVHARGAK
jgi:cytochrome c oxidase subunit 2